MLDRPEARNAQNRGMLVELHDAFLEAEADDDVRVVILGGNGKMFSAGHDMGSSKSLEEYRPGPNQHTTRRINGGTRVGSENLMLQEWHYFFQNTLRWRNLRKITVAQVHGPVYAAGLMLMWACDLIVAADDAEFADVVGTRLGMMGVEYFAHPWEFGPRKTKELLLTGDSITADETRTRDGRQGVPALRFGTAHARIREANRSSANSGGSARQGGREPDDRHDGFHECSELLFHSPPTQPFPLGDYHGRPELGCATRARCTQLA